jgi:anthranilate synthase/aminodeoxychorismate synthase-like glutamine amidotransferase
MHGPEAAMAGRRGCIGFQELEVAGHLTSTTLPACLTPVSNPEYPRDVLLVIDNYDSFTFNLVQYFGQLGVEMRVFRNDELTPADAERLNPDRVLISPGPCTPNEAGISLDIFKVFAGKIPIFGVCLGHQAMGQYFGGKVIRAGRLMHGKLSPIQHRGTDVFKGLPTPFRATRYHSLLVERPNLPDCLEITAETAEGEIMGLRHKQFPVWGVQFHPESIATENGMQILQNFLAMN